MYGYGKASKYAARKLIKLGVDIVLILICWFHHKSLKNGDIVFINKLLMKKRKLSTFKFDKDLLRNLKTILSFQKLICLL